jgi:ribosomal protein S18 acetylase RimI-like enzyme
VGAEPHCASEIFLGGTLQDMTAASRATLIRHSRLRDVARLRDLAKVCWHATYDSILGRSEAARTGGRAYSTFNVGYWICLSRLSRASTVLVAEHGGVSAGFAMSQRDGPEIILYSLYVHPDWQRKGIGSALLDAVIAGHPGANAIRLEVLRDNASAIAWYQAKGFERYGETKSATGTSDVPSIYMDRRLAGSLGAAA